MTPSQAVVDALAEAIREAVYRPTGVDPMPWLEDHPQIQARWRKQVEPLLRLLSERGYEIVPSAAKGE